MKDTLATLLQSKRFLTLVGSVLFVVATPVVGWFGYEIDTAKLDGIIALAATYLVSQGLADHGKSAAIITAAADAVKPVAPTNVVVGEIKGAS